MMSPCFQLLALLQSHTITKRMVETMKNSQQHGSMNPKVIKTLTLSASVTTLATLALVEFNLLPATPTIEVLATFVAFVVAGISLHYVYQEHQATVTEEQKLACDLVHQICSQGSSTLSKRLISQGVQNVLSNQPSHLLRIQALEYYKKDRLALDQLLNRLSHDQQDLDVLADLGLRWCPEVVPTDTVRGSTHS